MNENLAMHALKITLLMGVVTAAYGLEWPLEGFSVPHIPYGACNGIWYMARISWLIWFIFLIGDIIGWYMAPAVWLIWFFHPSEQGRSDLMPWERLWCSNTNTGSNTDSNKITVVMTMVAVSIMRREIPTDPEFPPLASR